MDYIITEVVGVKENVYEGKAGVRFKVRGVEHVLSTLTNTPEIFAEGETVHGTITSKEKDGKTFYNFNMPKTAVNRTTGALFEPKPDAIRMERKIDALLTEVQMLRGDMKGVLGEILSKLPHSDEPL